MVEATALKNGTTFAINNIPYKVIKYSHSKIARGGGTVKLTVRNLATGSSEAKTLNSNAKVDEISTTKRPLQYLYNDGTDASFMDERTYEQIEIPVSIIKDQLQYIQEGEVADVLFWSTPDEEKPLSVDIAAKVTLEVTQTDPGVKGNSATNIFKPAVLENGLSTKVPLFIKKGDKIRIDTKSGEYVERAK